MGENIEQIIRRVISLEEAEIQTYAKGTHLYGEFSFDGMRAEVFFSEEETKEYNVCVDILHDFHVRRKQIDAEVVKHAERTVYKRMQINAHELCHYLQSIQMPAFRQWRDIKRERTKLSTVIVLRHLDDGGYFVVTEDRNFLGLVLSERFKSLDYVAKQIMDALPVYEFYLSQYITRKEGISFRSIIESMAHVFSMCIPPDEENFIDYAGLSSHSIYMDAYRFYINNITIQGLTDRIKGIVFLYICMMACDVEVRQKNHKSEAEVSDRFRALCKNANTYLSTFIEKYKSLKSLSKGELISFIDSHVVIKGIKRGKKGQLIAISAIFHLINIMLNDGLKVRKEDDVYVSGVSKYGIYAIAVLCLFPESYGDLEKSHDNSQNIKIDNREFTNWDEAEFYSWIRQLQAFFIPRRDVECCKKHGLVSDRKKVLKCREEGGVADMLQRLIKRPVNDLIRMRNASEELK